MFPLAPIAWQARDILRIDTYFIPICVVLVLAIVVVAIRNLWRRNGDDSDE